MRHVTAEGAGEGAERLSFPPVIPPPSDRDQRLPGVVPAARRDAVRVQGATSARPVPRPSGPPPTKTGASSRTMGELAMNTAACYPVYPGDRRARRPAAGRSLGRHRGRLGVPSRAVAGPGPVARSSRCTSWSASPNPRSCRHGATAGSNAAWRGCGASGSTPPPRRRQRPFLRPPGAGCWPLTSARHSSRSSCWVQIAGPEPTAVASFNCHHDHFASIYGLTMADGRPPPHTACLGFGGERIIPRAVLHARMDPDAWPKEVKAKLAPSDAR